jgi:hypothetical protein
LIVVSRQQSGENMKKSFKKLDDKDKSKSKLSITFKNGSQILAAGENKDAVRGKHGKMTII